MAHNLPTDQEIPRREWRLIALLLVLGGVLRILFVGSFHVEHFDEGVYASNRWFTAEEGTRYPDRHLYAPPLWPAVLEYSQLLFGPSSFGVMFPGIVCGTLSILALWRLVRDWVGPAEALIVAAILMMSGFHILFSRTALTDVPLTLLMLWGIRWGWMSCARGSWSTAVAAGIGTGLAWSVKYNGWYPLAVTGAGLAAANLFHVKRSGVLFKQWGCWMLMAAVAGAVWFPAWWDLQTPARGGYAAVAANHSGYIAGWKHWLEQLQIQFENLAWFDNHIALTGLLVLLLASGLLIPRDRPDNSSGPDRRMIRFRESRPLIALIALLMVPWFLGLGISLPRTLFTLALFGLGMRLTELVRSPAKGEGLAPDVLAAWMAIAWFASLLLVTPLYRPYPRLALPFLLSVLVGAAYGLREIKRYLSGEGAGRDLQTDQASEPQTSGRPVSRGTLLVMNLWGAFSLVLGFLLVGSPVLPYSKISRVAPYQRESPWQPRLSMEEAAREVIAVCSSESEGRLSRPVAYVVYVFGEPALYYHLCRLAPQNVVVAPVSNLGFLNAPPAREPVPIFLLSGPDSDRDEGFQVQVVDAADRLHLVWQIEVNASALIWLNLYSSRDPQALSKLDHSVRINIWQSNPDSAAERREKNE